MDTDELSKETYEGVIVAAEDFDHNLTLQFGLIAQDCKNEKEYLDEAKAVIKNIRKMKDWHLEDIFFGEPFDKKELYITLDKILANIIEIEKIPEEKRNYDFDYDDEDD
jgi:hypothetical protein